MMHFYFKLRPQRILWGLFFGIHWLENYFGLGDYFALGLKAFSRRS